MKRTKRMKTFSSILLLIFLFLITGCSGTIPANNAPTINSIPITSSLVSVLYTYNVEATDSDGDALTYTLTSNPPGMTIDSSTGVISWTPNAVGDYSVILKVSDGESFDTQSFTITISLTEMTTLSPPAGVSASDGTYTDKVQITWNTVSGASHYQVYRADALLGSKTIISSWQTATSYDDKSVTAETVYYYWVKAAASSSGDTASDYSISDTGSSIVFSISLSPPAGVSASDGTYTDKVQITWKTVTEASHYQVYRADSFSGNKTAISGWQTGTSYDDTKAIPGDTYYYWVKAATSSSGGNASDYSEYNKGYASVMLPLSPPTGVSASDNLINKVEITWKAVSGASYYRVYRASNSSGIGRSYISDWQTSRTYDDTTVTPGDIYYYWVKAATSSSGDTASDYSISDTGSSIVFSISLSPPTGVSASDNLINKVEITWNAVSGASYYRVYRASNSFGIARSAISGWQTSRTYDDTKAIPGDTYYYWVKAATSSSGGNASDYSISDTGSSIVFSISLSPPTGVSASDNLELIIEITWKAVSGASYYRVYRASNSSGIGRSYISGWQTSRTYDDTTVALVTTYYYWVKAATSSSGDNASDYSACDSGFAIP